MRLLINAVGAQIGGAITHLRPFLQSLAVARPEWGLHVYVSPGQRDRLEGLALAGIVEWHGRTPLRRLSWDLHGVNHEAGRVLADGILNLTNYGPVASTVPSILFQRNAYYFDRSWLRRMSRPRQVEAAIRRTLSFGEISNAAVVVTPTQAMTDFIRSWNRCPKSTPFVVVPHAVDTARFPYRPRAFHSDGEIRLAVVSNPGRHKGADVAIFLTAELARRGRRSSLALTFDKHDQGAYRKVVRSTVDLVRRLGLEDRVDFLGDRNEPAAVYAGADVVVVPSYTESFGFPLVEAMASGRPVVASAIPALVEVGGDTVNWFPAGDARRAADRVEELASRPPALSMERLDRARARVEQLTWSRNAEDVATLVDVAIRGDMNRGMT